MSAIRILELSGDPYSRGFAHGRDAAAEVAGSLDIYRRWFLERAELTWTEATDRALQVAGSLAATPELELEMRGIAAGAGVEFVDVLALNWRTEIGYRELWADGPSECTAMAVNGSASASGAPLIGENWDWIPETRETLIGCLHRPDDGVEFLTFTEAGMLGKFGINAAGITVCVNLLGSSDSGIGLGFHPLVRLALQAKGLTSVLKAISRNPRAGAGNILAASGDGEVVDIEWSAHDYNVLFPQRGVIAHANHFESPPRGVTDRTKLSADASPGTYLRSERARTLLSADGPLDLDGFLRVFRNHFDSEESICRHAAAPGSAFGATNASFVVDYASSRVLISHGNPCETDYVSIDLPWSLRSP